MIQNPSDLHGSLRRSFRDPCTHIIWNLSGKNTGTEIKPMDETGEIVLSRVVVPEYIVVHDGESAGFHCQKLLCKI